VRAARTCPPPAPAPPAEAVRAHTPAPQRRHPPAEAVRAHTPAPQRRHPPAGTAARRRLKIAAAATAVGLLTGFFGVGGGFVIVPALVIALGFEMPVAVGTSLLVIAINSAVALTARLGGHVQLAWPLLGVFTVAALTAAFTVLLIAVAAYSLTRSLPGLV
jgi:uncharacterized membrane protein YfcA